jgi:hypothetical protein
VSVANMFPSNHLSVSLLVVYFTCKSCFIFNEVKYFQLHVYFKDYLVRSILLAPILHASMNPHPLRHEFTIPSTKERTSLFLLVQGKSETCGTELPQLTWVALCSHWSKQVESLFTPRWQEPNNFFFSKGLNSGLHTW